MREDYFRNFTNLGTVLCSRDLLMRREIVNDQINNSLMFTNFDSKSK